MKRILNDETQLNHQQTPLPTPVNYAVAVIASKVIDYNKMSHGRNPRAGHTHQNFRNYRVIYQTQQQSFKKVSENSETSNLSTRIQSIENFEFP
jgi:hypothetical protein